MWRQVFLYVTTTRSCGTLTNPPGIFSLRLRRRHAPLPLRVPLASSVRLVCAVCVSRRSSRMCHILTSLLRSAAAGWELARENCSGGSSGSRGCCLAWGPSVSLAALSSSMKQGRRPSSSSSSILFNGSGPPCFHEGSSVLIRVMDVKTGASEVVPSQRWFGSWNSQRATSAACAPSYLGQEAPYHQVRSQGSPPSLVPGTTATLMPSCSNWCLPPRSATLCGRALL